MPDPGAVLAGSDFTIGSSWAARPDGDVYVVPNGNGGLEFRTLPSPTLQTHSPQVEAYVDLVAEFHAFAGAQACIGVCTGPARAVRHQCRGRAGGDQSGRRRPDSPRRHLGRSQRRLQLSTTSSPDTCGCPTSTPLTGFRTAAATSTPRKTPSSPAWTPTRADRGEFGRLSLAAQGQLQRVRLQSAAGGRRRRARDNPDPRLRPVPQATLQFSGPVQQRLSNGSYGAPTTTISFALGDSVTLKAPGAAGLGVFPTLSLSNTVSNRTGLLVTGNVGVTGAGRRNLRIENGPLVKEKASTGQLGSIPIFGSEFQLNVAPIVGRPFNIAFTELPLLDATCVAEGMGRVQPFRVGRDQQPAPLPAG